jgi:hypothetical protein
MRVPSAAALLAVALAGTAHGQSAPPPLSLQISNTSQDMDCRGRDVTIAGTGDMVALHGGCRSLTVWGADNHVQAELLPNAVITVQGDRNNIEWFLSRPGPPPVAQISGQGSFVKAMARLGSIVTPPSAVPQRPDLPPPIELVGDGQRQDIDCTGRDVRIDASGSDVVLHGGCRSLFLQGNGTHVQAELMPGTRVTLIGNGDQVAFALIGAGPDPIVSVNGTHSDAWRVQRLGATSRADASRGVVPTPGGMAVHGGAGASVSQMPAVPQPLSGD